MLWCAPLLIRFFAPQSLAADSYGTQNERHNPFTWHYLLSYLHTVMRYNGRKLLHFPRTGRDFSRSPHGLTSSQPNLPTIWFNWLLSRSPSAWQPRHWHQIPWPGQCRITTHHLLLCFHLLMCLSPFALRWFSFWSIWAFCWSPSLSLDKRWLWKFLLLFSLVLTCFGRCRRVCFALPTFWHVPRLLFCP